MCEAKCRCPNLVQVLNSFGITECPDGLNLTFGDSLPSTRQMNIKLCRAAFVKANESSEAAANMMKDPYTAFKKRIGEIWPKPNPCESETVALVY